MKQAALTREELKTIFAFIPDISLVQETSTDNEITENITLTEVEESAIFEARSVKEFVWELEKSNERRNAKCSTCKATMPPGKIFFHVKGLFIPPNQAFSVDRRFYFCASFRCVKKGTSS